MNTRGVGGAVKRRFLVLACTSAAAAAAASVAGCCYSYRIMKHVMKQDSLRAHNWRVQSANVLFKMPRDSAGNVVRGSRDAGQILPRLSHYTEKLEPISLNWNTFMHIGARCTSYNPAVALITYYCCSRFVQKQKTHTAVPLGMLMK